MKLRLAYEGYWHWCPGCKETHRLPVSWKFNDNMELPTFTPSFKHVWSKDEVCHYVLTDGILHFCGDSTHRLKGQSVPLPELPEDERSEG